MNPPTKVCPNCQHDLGDAIAAGTSKCPECGRIIDGGGPVSSAKRRFGKLDLLRWLLALDALVLFLLGALFICVPKHVESAFHFQDLPYGVSYVIGLFGCVFATMALGYATAATDPLRHIVWVQVGIARGTLECVLGAVYLANKVVTWQQARLGILVAAFITIAYIVLYPRKTHVIRLVAVKENEASTRNHPTP